MKTIIFTLVLLSGLCFCKAQGPQWQVYNISNSGLPHNSIQCISVDVNNVKWIGTWGGGMAKFDDLTWASYSPSNGTLADTKVYSIVNDTNGRVVIGTQNSGLVIYDRNSNIWHMYLVQYCDIISNQIENVFIDNTGNIWLASSSGIGKFDGTTWTKFNPNNSGLPSWYVKAIKQDSDGMMWFATWGGLVSFDGTSWTIFNSSNSGLPFDELRTLDIDINGNIWMGSSDAGLTKFDGTTWTTFNTSNSEIPSTWINHVTTDNTGIVWVSTNNGLAKFDGTEWTVFNASNSSLPTNWVSSVAFDSNNNKWIGTTGGLAVYNENGITTSASQQISGNNLSLYPNPASDNLWISIENQLHQTVNVSVFNCQNVQVQNEVLHPNENSVDISQLAPGMYFLRYTDEKKTYTQKFVKSR